MNYKLKLSKLGVRTLVAERPNLGGPFTLLWTVSPNPRAKVDAIKAGKSIKLEYGKLRQCLQMDYLHKYLTRAVIPTLEMYEPFELVGTTELNQHGDLHLHMIVKSSVIKNDTTLHMLRRDVLNDPIVQRHLGRKGTDYMNNIVEITDPFDSVVTYLEKDQDKNIEWFPNYTVQLDGTI